MTTHKTFSSVFLDIIIRFRSKPFFTSDVLKLASGTAFAQLLGILTTPLLTRLYPPEAFGLAAVFISITGIVSAVMCLRYEQAIMLPETDEEAVNLLAVSIGFAMLVSLLTAFIIWWGKTLLLRALNIDMLAPYLWLMPVAAWLGGVFNALNYWNSRTRQFGRLSVTRMVSSFVTAVATLGAGLIGIATAGAKIGANVGGQALAAIILSGQIWRDDRKLFIRSLHWRDISLVLKRYRKFPLYDTWSTLLNTASWQLPVLLLSSFFSPIVVGHYALGYRILQLPMNFVGTAIAQVFFQRASGAYIQGKLDIVVESAFRRLVMVGLFPVLTLTIIGRDLFSVVFGASWAEAGVYTQILSIWAFFWFISSPLSTVFRVLEKQEFLLKWNLFNLIIRFFSLWIGGVLQNPRLAVFLFSSSGVVVYGYITLAILLQANVPMHQAMRVFRKYLLIFLPAGSILLCLSAIGVSVEIRLLVASLMFACYFLAVTQATALRSFASTLTDRS